MPLQSAMVRCLRQAFTEDAKSRSWRRVISAVTVGAVGKPLRYAHENRSRPVARTEHWITFWANKGKAKSETGEKEGFRWSVATFEPILKDACDTIWDEWHSLAQQRRRAQQDLPEYLCFDAVTGAEVTLAQYNSAVEDMTAGALAKDNEVAISSRCLRRVPPGLCT